MVHIAWWEGAAGALLGALVGSGVPLFWGWYRRRIERLGEIIAMEGEMHQAKILMESLGDEKAVLAPSYRLPLVMFEKAVPKLIGEGKLTTNETAALIEYIIRVEELNRGLDRAGQAAAMNQMNPLKDEFNRNRDRARRMVTEKLDRLEDRTVFQAAIETLLRVEGVRRSDSGQK